MVAEESDALLRNYRAAMRDRSEEFSGSPEIQEWFVDPDGVPPLSASAQRRWLVALVLLGVTLRVVRFLLPFPLWGDECMLAVNFLDRSWADMLRPLEYCQIAPLGFLWAELAAVKLLGFSTWSLHLFPTLCSLAALGGFVWMASRVLRGWPLVLATGTMAVAYYPIRYGAEVKQYSCELLVSVVLLGLALQWFRRPEQLRWLWTLCAVVPVALVFSLPGVFVAGGISLFVLAMLLCRKLGTRAWTAWAVYNLVLVAAFLVLLVKFIQPHSTPEVRQGVGRYWAEAFLPWQEPWRVPQWLLRVHFGRMFSYPQGGKNGGSTLTTLGFLLGLGVLGARRKHRVLLVLVLVPFGLALVASALRRYPYGFAVRTALYLAPLICTVAALGWSVAVSRVAQARAPRMLRSVAVGLFALGMAVGAFFLLKPYKTPYDRTHDQFARWFWTHMAQGAELVCAQEELSPRVYPEQRMWFMAEFECYKHLYSARHRTGRPPRWSAISAQHPLRCVVLVGPEPHKATPHIQRWLRQMQKRYALVSYQRLPVNPQGGVFYARSYDVFEFVPRDQVAQYTPPYRR